MQVNSKAMELKEKLEVLEKERERGRERMQACVVAFRLTPKAYL